MPGSSINNDIGVPLIEIQSVDSTNNYAMDLIRKGLAQHGTSVFAHEQTHGKGQRGKKWLASAGENMILSVILNTTAFQMSQQFMLSMCIAIAVHDFFSKYAGDETFVKWPNDLYWRDRKAGGILIENIVVGKEWQWAIVGIGININQTRFEKDIVNAVSLKQITGQNFDIHVQCKELFIKLNHWFQILKGGNTKAILNTYNNALYKKDKTVYLKKNNVVFKCVVKGVNEYGFLITESVTEELHRVGEIEWIK